MGESLESLEVRSTPHGDPLSVSRCQISALRRPLDKTIRQFTLLIDLHSHIPSHSNSHILGQKTDGIALRFLSVPPTDFRFVLVTNDELISASLVQHVAIDILLMSHFSQKPQFRRVVTLSVCKGVSLEGHTCRGPSDSDRCHQTCTLQRYDSCPGDDCAPNLLQQPPPNLHHSNPNLTLFPT